jgi:hypothetical protein
MLQFAYYLGYLDIILGFYMRSTTGMDYWAFFFHSFITH